MKPYRGAQAIGVEQIVHPSLRLGVQVAVVALAARQYAAAAQHCVRRRWLCFLRLKPRPFPSLRVVGTVHAIRTSLTFTAVLTARATTAGAVGSFTCAAVLRGDTSAYAVTSAAVALLRATEGFLRHDATRSTPQLDKGVCCFACYTVHMLHQATG